MTHSQSRRQVIRQAAALSVGASGLLGARSSVEIVSAQTYTGTTTLAGGTLVVSNAGALGAPATAAGPAPPAAMRPV